MTPESRKPRRTTTRGRRLLQLVETWWDEQARKLRAWVERGLTALLVFGLLAVFAAALLVLSAARLIDGLAHALSAAWNGPDWTGDLAVGLLVPAVVIGLVLRAHQRRVRRRDAQSRDER
jgi:uncharacterized BrkB/YihY/UPF0761 family membrane protein